MTFAPTTLLNLQTYWLRQSGVPLGIVGDTGHQQKGTSYHLGKDDLAPGAYSAQLPRDRAGLSNAASAIDLGRLTGTLPALRRFSEWFVGECMADPVKYRDVREVIYATADGVYVKRYSHPDHAIYTSLRRTPDGIKVVTPGNGDASHFTHTHISYYRDSVGREKVSLFAPYFLPDTSTGGEPVKSFPVPEARTLCRVSGWLYDNSAMAASAGNVQLSAPRDLVLVGTYGDARIVAYEPPTGDTGTNSKAMYARLADVDNIRPASDDTPFDQQDRNESYNNGLAAAAAAIAAIPRK